MQLPEIGYIALYNPEHSINVQRTLFNLGFRWARNGTSPAYTNVRYIVFRTLKTNVGNNLQAVQTTASIPKGAIAVTWDFLKDYRLFLCHDIDNATHQFKSTGDMYRMFNSKWYCFKNVKWEKSSHDTQYLAENLVAIPEGTGLNKLSEDQELTKLAEEVISQPDVEVKPELLSEKIIQAVRNKASVEKPQSRSAGEIADTALEHIKDRAVTYDQPSGERSAAKTAKAFNAITGKDLTEGEVWLILQLVKDVRQWSRATYHKDSAEDCIAYAALKAEALEREDD